MQLSTEESSRGSDELEGDNADVSLPAEQLAAVVVIMALAVPVLLISRAMCQFLNSLTTCRTCM